MSKVASKEDWPAYDRQDREIICDVIFHRDAWLANPEQNNGRHYKILAFNWALARLKDPTTRFVPSHYDRLVRMYNTVMTNFDGSHSSRQKMRMYHFLLEQTQ